MIKKIYKKCYPYYWQTLLIDSVVDLNIQLKTDKFTSFCGFVATIKRVPVRAVKNPTTLNCNIDKTYKCKDDYICLPLARRCDGVYDCMLGDDELNCPQFIEKYKFNFETFNNGKLSLNDGTINVDHLGIYENGIVLKISLKFIIIRFFYYWIFT